MGKHKQEVEANKVDAYTTSYENVNKIGFVEAYKIATELDSGLLEDSPDWLNLERAIVTLARRVTELETEWS